MEVVTEGMNAAQLRIAEGAETAPSVLPPLNPEEATSHLMGASEMRVVKSA